MLQYAVPNASHQVFHRPAPVFADPPSRPQSTISQHDDRSSNGYNIPRPPPTISQASNEYHRRSFGGLEAGTADIQHLPALSALASLAANAPAAAMNPPASTSEGSTRSSTPSSNANMSAQYAPAATAGGSSAGPPICGNCGTQTTPLWRRDESGSVLCNACGLFLKLHGRPRPISLKTDVIKSRNRVKTSQPKKRDSQGQDGFVHATNGFLTAQSDAAHPGLQQHSHQHGLPIGMGEHQSQQAPSPGTGSRSNTPAIGHGHNIAPQHIFDTVTLPSDTFASPSLPAFALRQPSPAPSSATTNGNTNGQMEPPQNYDTLVSQNNTLRTRVSELEVINDLFRGRVAELEASEQDARRKECMKDEETQRIRAELEAATSRAAEFERRLAELEVDGPARKRTKINDGARNGSNGSMIGVDNAEDAAA